MMTRMLSAVLALMLISLPCAYAEAVVDPVPMPAITPAPGDTSTVTAEPIVVMQADAGKLTVTGSATVSLPADAAMISLGVRESAENVQDAQSVVNQKIAAIRAALVDLGIDNKDITTESMYVYANYNYDGGMDTITSYSATNTLCITVRDLENAGSVIDAAFAAGANTLDTVSFYATDESAANDQAYAEAVAQAMHKAQVIAEAAGMQLGSIQDISESGSTYYAYDNGSKLRASTITEDAAAGADIQASSVVVSAEVSITYTLSSN